MSQMEKLVSLKGKPMLLHQGYIYTIERTTETKLVLRCQNRDCKARCHTNLSMDAFISSPTLHFHGPSTDKVPAIKLKNEIKVRTAMTEETKSTILHSALRTYLLSAAGELPKNEALMIMIRRQRTAEKVDVDGCLPEKLRRTYRGEDLILHEYKTLIIFTTKTNLSILKRSKNWFADGTFKVCSDDYYQLFTLHAMMKNVVIPLVYRVLIGKSHNDYNSFFRKVLQQDNFQPESIMTDFETGTIKSVKEMLPNVVRKGCLFHFAQAVWRNIQSNGLPIKYDEDACFRLNVKKLIALAFLPLDKIVAGFDLVAAQFDDDADDLLDYVERTWIGEPRRRGAGRKKPQFDHTLWNIHDRVFANVLRSNNAAEGWHNAFAKRVATIHPSITKLAEKIRREQSKFEVDMAKILQGRRLVIDDWMNASPG